MQNAAVIAPDKVAMLVHTHCASSVTALPKNKNKKHFKKLSIFKASHKRREIPNRK